MNNIIFFDLETQNTFEELGMNSFNSKNPSKLKVAIAGILFDNTNNHMFFGESNIQTLLTTLNKADLIIGHNLFRFDYPVLQKYTDTPINSFYNKTFDTMFELEQYTNGCWTSLDDLCRLNLGEGKPHSGALIPQLWRNHQFKEVEKYLLNDLMKTKDIYYYIKNNKKVKYTHKNYGEIIGEREVKVDW